MSNLQLLHDKTRAFMNVTESLTQEPHFEQFEGSRTPHKQVGTLLELITFELSQVPRTQFLFSRFWEVFKRYYHYKLLIFRMLSEILIYSGFRTTDINARIDLTYAPIPTANEIGSYFHCQNPPHPSDSIPQKPFETLRFHTMIRWHSVKAMEEWYGDFANGCQIYERLGHKIDALRCLCPDIAKIKSKNFKVNVEEGNTVKRVRRVSKFPKAKRENQKATGDKSLSTLSAVHDQPPDLQ
jgi:hypothetical protein